jgi:hypothetical protein
MKESAMRILRGAIVGWLVITFFQMLVGGLVPAPGLPPQPPNALPWLLLSNLVVASVLSWMALGSRLYGTRLALLLCFVTLVANQISSFLEGVFFHVLTVPTVIAILPNTIVPVVAAIFTIVWATGTWREPACPAPSATSIPWGVLVTRGVILSMIYVVLYIVAGTFVFPFVRDYYATRVLPPGGLILAMQLFVRGPMFVVVIALLVWQMPVTRGRQALAAALLMSIIAGAAPLMVPNGIFPDAVRWAHFVEVVTSNAVFGAIAGWLLGPGRAILPAPAASFGAAGKERAHERVS